MSTWLYLAAFLSAAVGLAHSILGERYILIRLFRRDNLPRLFGGTQFTQRTLRFAWHLTTVAYWGFAAILVLMAGGDISFRSLSWVLAATFLTTATIVLIASRGRHLAWIVFLVIGGVSLYAAVM